MTRDEALAILIAHRGELEARGVAHAALFGSTARNEAGPESDVDILIDLAPGRRIGVFEFVSIQDFVGDLFPGDVDVVLGRSLAAALRPAVGAEAVYAF